MRQEVLMQELGVDEVYIDRLSGKNTDRPEPKKMMDYVRKGDTVIVESISRFARNTRDLLELIDKLSEKGVEFVSRKEAIDTTTPTGKFMLTVFGAVAELEREYILQRQREGIAIAKAQGKYTGRKPIERSNFDAVEKLWRAGTISAAEAMRRRVSPSAAFLLLRSGGGTPPFRSSIPFAAAVSVASEPVWMWFQPISYSFSCYPIFYFVSSKSI